MSDAERERRIALFTPTLERLVALIRGRVRFHENFDSWHRDERQDFKRARQAGCSCAAERLRGCTRASWVLRGERSQARRLVLTFKPCADVADSTAAALVHCQFACNLHHGRSALPAPPRGRRVAVGDTLIDCATVLGGGRMLQLLVEPLLELSKQVTGGAAFDWRTAEAALYCIRAVHRCAPLPGDPLMTSLFSSLPMLPAVPQLQYTVALTIGAYSDWLADTARRGEEGRTLLSQVRGGAELVALALT